MEHPRQEILKILQRETSNQSIPIEEPTDRSLGDIAVPCFFLAKEMRKNPAQIAQELAQSINDAGLPDMIDNVEANGPYLNFFLHTPTVAAGVLTRIRDEKDSFGKGKGKDRKVLIESPSPNTNKPLHLGHLRNMLLGRCLKNILSFMGADAKIVNVVNDRGVHICKSMLAYERFGNEETPESAGRKPDHLVGDYYVMFSKAAQNDPDLKQEAQDMLLKWEQGDEKIHALWKMLNGWVLRGFRETYERLGFEIDEEEYESDLYTHGKEIILNALERDVFQRDEEGAVIADLTDVGLDTKVLLRPNGTSVYITQDIYLGKRRYDNHAFDEMIYVVGSEQQYHFRVLFELFRRLGYSFADACRHFAYGMVDLPEGKMKSREGTVIDTDTLLDEVEVMARDELSKRYTDLSEEELAKRTRQITHGAVSFYFLRYDPLKDFTYNPVESIAFEGETGPYVQYTHARICSIERKAQEKGVSPDERETFANLTEDESKRMIQLLYEFSGKLDESARKLDPSLLTRYLLDLSQAFNEFYHKYPILKEEPETAQDRLHLALAVRQVLQTGLGLLGIEAPERM